MQNSVFVFEDGVLRRMPVEARECWYDTGEKCRHLRRHRERAVFRELLIDGEKLAEVSPIPFGGAGCRGPDARGMAVTPGFIDAHRHCDLAALYDPEFGRLELAQGITTAVMGNCGLAPAPCTEEYRDRLYDFWSPVWAQLPKTVFSPLVSEFFRALETRRYPLNLGVLGGHQGHHCSVKGIRQCPL